MNVTPTAGSLALALLTNQAKVFLPSAEVLSLLKTAQSEAELAHIENRRSFYQKAHDERKQVRINKASAARAAELKNNQDAAVEDPASGHYGPAAGDVNI